MRKSQFILCVLASLIWITHAVASTEENDSTQVTDAEAHSNFLERDQCVVCHIEEDMMPEHFLEEDVHMQAELSCAGCHGGDPESDDEDVAMSEAAGFIGVPDKADIPDFCGRCHSRIEFMRTFRPRIQTDQVTQYYTSLHGQRLREGDPKVANCTSCHTSHAILPPNDTRSSVHPFNVPETCQQCHGDPDYMREYNIPTNQYDKFARSVHGVALLENEDTGAPACNDCHGNHGAMPPEVSSVTQICGQCHVNNMDYFQETKMAEAFIEDELHGCEECHGNHDVVRTTDEMVGGGESSVCTDCHDSGDRGYESAVAIRTYLDSLTTAYARAQELHQEVHRRGMDDVEIAFVMQEAHHSLIQARTLVHTFDPNEVAVKTREGTERAEEAIAMSHVAVQDFYVRRRGFGLATVFISLLAVALFFKIRQLDR